MSIATDTSINTVLRVAFIGAGYWGPNPARNFAMSSDWDLVAICDMNLDRAGALARKTGEPAVVGSMDELLSGHETDAVAQAVPAHNNYSIAMQAIAAGKHVLVEKPLADNTAHGEATVRSAVDAGTVLRANHSCCYTPAVPKIRELLATGELREILYIDSTRIYLGPVQPDADVFGDLATCTCPS